MSHRRTEHAHDTVADMLVHSAALALDDRVNPREKGVQERMHRLGPKFLGQSRVADEISEQDGDVTTLAR